MGREVRMVPQDWAHPTRDNGRYIPLFGDSFKECAKDWDEECAKWEAGNCPEYASEEDKGLSYSEWGGERPEESDYMPTFEEGTTTYYMMYETCSEGTPISPAFETPEELARWLFETGANAFAHQAATYKGWLRVAKGGYALSAVLSRHKGLQSGVDALTEFNE